MLRAFCSDLANPFHYRQLRPGRNHLSILKTMTDKKSTIVHSSTENIIALLTVLGIGGYLLLKQALDINHAHYTLDINTNLASAISSLYKGHLGFSTSLVQVPLLMVLALGSIPFVFQLIEKLFQGNFGSDLLAGISIVTAVLLDEYLDGSLVVQIFSDRVTQ